MDEMAQSATFIAASTNRFSHAADASSDSLVALGSGNLVALWDVTARRSCANLGQIVFIF